MVDAEDLGFLEDRSDGVVDGTRRCEIVAIGFSSTTRDDASTNSWVARCAEIGPNKLGAQAR